MSAATQGEFEVIVPTRTINLTSEPFHLYDLEFTRRYFPATLDQNGEPLTIQWLKTTLTVLYDNLSGEILDFIDAMVLIVPESWLDDLAEFDNIYAIDPESLQFTEDEETAGFTWLIQADRPL